MIAESGIELLEQLRSASGAKNADFQKYYVPLLFRLAQYVQELPLDKVSHSEPRGAFRFGLTAALLTMRMSDGVLFSTAFGAEMMGKLNPQFRLSAFAASLATVPLLVHHNMQIVLAGRDWSYLSGVRSLHEELQAVGGCSVRWKSPPKPPSAALGTILLSQFFTPGLWADSHPAVIDEMCIAINPAGIQAAVETQLAKIVRTGHEKAHLIDERARTPLYAKPDAHLSTQDAISHAINETPAAQKSAPASTLPPSTGTSSPPRAPLAATPTPLTSPSSTPAPSESFPGEFLEWVSAVKASDEHRKSLIFNQNGTVTVPISALTGFGMSARDLVEKFSQLDLVVEKDAKAKTATLKSRATALFK